MGPAFSLRSVISGGINSLLFLSFLCCLSPCKGANPVYLYTVCPNTTTYPSNGTYQNNLNLLLSSLSSNATPTNHGFYNTTAGRGSNTVYGLFLCRGDVTDDLCRECVKSAAQTITQRCPNGKVAITWYDECLLRYSNQSFFSIMDETPSFSMYNTQNNSDPRQFNQLVGDKLGELATTVASSASKYATLEANYTSFQSLYCLAQCTPDLSGSSCNQCLRGAISHLPVCCSGAVGARAVRPSCNVRYEVYPFYRITASVPAPSPLPLSTPPTSNTTTASGKGKKTSTGTIVAIVIPVVIAVLLLSTFGYCWLSKKTRKKITVGTETKGVESLQFNFSTVAAATNNFSDANKIGEGGFGSVYKGKFPNGQEIAVKRLSKNSGQGAVEFKNEAMLVAKLQHRNLVRLLGFCLEGEEKILIYEYVVNKSLDHFLFDPDEHSRLDWPIRYKIIEGTARGLLYLHEDSRLKIIHRDLKVSNVLLDGDLNPKISDFGMARIFQVDQSEANTNRIVGTYGYMSPEYAMHGQFSVKSDVFSFGVLLLEIVTGKKNSSFFQSDYAEDLLSYVWKHWNEGTALELVDPILGEAYSRDEVMKCIHIGLLCTQDDVADRPTMATVVLMLNSNSVTLAVPSRPAVYASSKMFSGVITGGESEGKATESDQSATKSMPWSVNEVSITELQPR
ncbi:PREDICTED: cysteine-rich receptor-like protein kinase 10 [Nelumbo nucifera]|uniref:Cysteine-rich receptor-like protein kinase 10 n=2 Tax=Nelumbo nucifera TaxID=4432 RepID=A0A822XVX0_NELNU|nr:PREDICTED: cysteine-rich receptor-like protein kinase 10 [Nelumbo nucifera]DAD23239.1 TPA_asm: hypothetical protein HUJ06_024702 [Nelumbo nucifera]